MTGTASIPEAEWARVKPFIREEYLIKNRTAETVQVDLQRYHNFVATTRKLKMKFELWKWDKKITRLHYGAMGRILTIHENAVFFIPRNGGTKREHLDAKKINKENKRKKAGLAKKGMEPVPLPDLMSAREILREAGITWEIPQPAANRPRTLSNRQTQLKPSSQHMVATNGDDDDYDDDSDDDSDGSTTPSEDGDPMDERDLIVGTSQHLNSLNFRPPLHSTQNAEPPRAHATTNRPQLPFKSAYIADLHNNLFPHRPTYQLRCPIVSIADANEQDPITKTDSAICWNLQELMDVVASLGIRHTPAEARDRAVAVTVAEYYSTSDPNEHKKDVLEFAGYWIVQLLVGHETPDAYDHSFRRKIRSDLSSMLQRENMELLPACYWIASVIMSYDRNGLLLAFFEDCLDTIETTPSYLASILKPWIHFMVIFHRDLYRNYQPTSNRLSREYLTEVERSFNASYELQRSIDDLARKGYLESNTGLILCIYRAWHISKENPNQGVIMLLDCLQRAEVAFGSSHLVTIQCAHMVAQGYKDSGDALAECHLGWVIMRLSTGSKMLRPMYYRSLLTHARYLLGNGRLQEARNELEVVFDYHSYTFGAQSPLTWEAANELFEVLNRQGFAYEAQQRRAALRSLFDQQWKERPTIY